MLNGVLHGFCGSGVFEHCLNVLLLVATFWIAMVHAIRPRRSAPASGGVTVQHVLTRPPARCVVFAFVLVMSGLDTTHLAARAEAEKVLRPNVQWQPSPRPCVDPLDVVIGRAVLRIPVQNRRWLRLFGASLDHERDCSIQRVKTEVLYVRAQGVVSPDHFGAKRPNRFEIYPVRQRDGRPWPYSSYAVDKVRIDALLDDPAVPVTEAGFHHDNAKLVGTYVMPVSRYSTPFGEPFVVSCAPHLKPECSTAYHLNEDLYLKYWFDPGTFAEREWIELDRLMRRFVASAIR